MSLKTAKASPLLLHLLICLVNFEKEVPLQIITVYLKLQATAPIETVSRKFNVV